MNGGSCVERVATAAPREMDATPRVAHLKGRIPLLAPGPPPSKIELAALALATALVGLWTWIALHDTTTFDGGIYYQVGQAAWANGHPEQLSSWYGTPTMAAIMAIVSRAMLESTAMVLLTCLNGLLYLGMLVYAWSELRARGARAVAALTLVAGGVFAPAASTIFWKQFNIVVLALAVAAFVLARRRHHRTAGLLIALSITIKPLVILLPVALLLRRSTRRTALWSIAFGVILIVLGQGFLAWRAGSPSDLNIFTPLATFLSKGDQPANIWACHPENFSPTSTLCRLVGSTGWTEQRLTVALFVLMLAVIAADLLRRLPATSWYVFAFAVMLSPMISPIAWSHYQVLLAPMFVMLAWELSRHGGRISEYVTLMVAFALAELVWRPYGTLPGLIHQVLGAKPQAWAQMFPVFAVSEFAQYVLFLCAVLVLTRVTARSIGHVSSPSQAT
jgi:hypothetical protein